MSPSTPPISRLAPTPSGHLHRGNALNFILTWALTRRAGGKLWLRIDDVDPTRARPEYVASIFRDLEWLGLDWDAGPQTVEAFDREHSFAHFRGCYREEVAQLWEQGGPLYACTCTRRKIQGMNESGGYPGLCRSMGYPLTPGRSTLRLYLPQAGEAGWKLGDPVVWTKGDAPAYQLASLLADRDMGVDLVVRGEDLLPSTALQRAMAPLFGAERFAAGRFVHHPLIAGNGGAKLSKSRGAPSLRDGLSDPLPLYRMVAPLLGIEPGVVGQLQDLLGPVTLPPSGLTAD